MAFAIQPSAGQLVQIAGGEREGGRTGRTSTEWIAHIAARRAAMPDTGSITPAVTARVVAGSRTVPSGIVRPRMSVLVLVPLPVMMSARFV